MLLEVFKADSEHLPVKWGSREEWLMLVLVVYSVGKLYTSLMYCCPPNWEKVPGEKEKGRVRQEMTQSFQPPHPRTVSTNSQLRKFLLLMSEPGLGGAGGTGQVLHLSSVGSCLQVCVQPGVRQKFHNKINTGRFS